VVPATGTTGPFHVPDHSGCGSLQPDVALSNRSFTFCLSDDIN
jgi:hypothetical protein